PAAPAAAAPAEASPAASACLQAGPFDNAQADALRQALAAAGVPASAWALEPIAAPERWIVYMGRYADSDALEKKRAELRALRVDTAPITLAGLAPGLSLGVFSSPESANEHLAQLTRRGVRTARVVAEQRGPHGARLRLPSADAALRAQVQGLGPALAGRSLSPC
ncbi:MAG TPA: SPOR domain-containing protein, partial [Pseudorhodoferax sp.]|nr:SPOR domain-containing protein [Pseudorhodoferax sp.]